ncbi:DNA/RNA non-specific endonuclease [Marinifilum caeruleilacunae]|uniref:DNA/RNA non-specific endonuclease n=1 Tax=Marinifilum caeruleilacunae TaxID=2499076 RepID=A0ABX1WSI9_9BACT|nr:DNA/RNA non-specific endonuclease [Marinifilum caeruleilacunae]NOU58894.1 DNA/RNA non-specific endonuclease [Marinifilum caeruleilacunae]
MKTFKKQFYILIVFFTSFYSSTAIAQKYFDELTIREKSLYDEHMKWGQPDNNKILVRTAYVNSFNAECRIPNYTVYHIIPDYLKTPERKSRFKKFREDPDINDAVKDNEYDGLFRAFNYARGHYCPYKVLGGDRDKDGKYANFDKKMSDIDDELTIFEGNYMSNIVPQLHYGLNGSGGVWFKAERWIQDDIVAKGNEVWVYSGGILIDDREAEKVGDNNSIFVPDYFYKVVVMENGADFPHVIVFYFPHHDSKNDYIEKDIFKYTVTIDYLEAITGYDFFDTYPEAIQTEFETKEFDTTFWRQF